ncbi:MAG: hypothetical protein CM1200mP30_16320 [Pseudomonadota bacterium]|nr:MAG: hypothetical protein CM1200mP30_16320 [Pseudomonadota bacterium]
MGPGENMEVTADWHSLMKILRVVHSFRNGQLGRAVYRRDTMGNIFAREMGRARIMILFCPEIILILSLQEEDLTDTWSTWCTGSCRSLNDHGIETVSPVEIVVWTNEEGARFPPSMMGSGVFTGIFEQDEIYKNQDPEGITVEDELRRTGQLGMFPVNSFRSRLIMNCILNRDRYWKMKKSIGVVTSGQGSVWTHITLSDKGPTLVQLPWNIARTQ